MSKIATLKSLPTPSDVRENVQELGRMLAETSERLDQTARQVQSLEQLPSLVAEQVSESLKALDPILRMRQDVMRVLEAYDQVTDAQRSSLESMASEISDRATKGMELKAGALDKTFQDLASQVQGLKSSLSTMQQSSKNLQALPTALDTAARAAAETLENSSQDLHKAAQSVRPSRWLTLGQMLGAAVLGALLVAAGQAGLSRILPPTETQQSAEWAVRVWNQATESEKKSLSQIVSRPAR